MPQYEEISDTVMGIVHNGLQVGTITRITGDEQYLYRIEMPNYVIPTLANGKIPDATTFTQATRAVENIIKINETERLTKVRYTVDRNAHLPFSYVRDNKIEPKIEEHEATFTDPLEAERFAGHQRTRLGITNVHIIGRK